MNQRIVALIQYCAIVFTLSGVNNMGAAVAQNKARVICGEAKLSSFSINIPGFRGQYYYIAEWGQDDADARELGLITAQGEHRIPITLDPRVARSVGEPFVSPDGSKIAFTPFSIRSHNLLIWDRITNETTTFELTQELADYLSDHDDTPDLAVINFNKLIWHNQSELVIQYFGENGDVRNPLQTLDLTIQDQPLRITASAPATALNLQATPNPNPSSQETFATSAKVFTVETRESPAVLGGREFRVTDAASHAAVFTVQSSKEYRVGQPFWTPDGNYLFYLAVVPSGMKLIQVNVGQGFTQETTLDSILEKQFGTSTGITTTIPPILSRDGTNLGFGYLDQIHNQYYVIRYNPRTGETTTVCDEAPTSGNLYPFWSPSNRFIAYWYGGTVKVYDFDTGNRYLLPGRGFAGWISEKP